MNVRRILGELSLNGNQQQKKMCNTDLNYLMSILPGLSIWLTRPLADLGEHMQLAKDLVATAKGLYYYSEASSQERVGMAQELIRLGQNMCAAAPKQFVIEDSEADVEYDNKEQAQQDIELPPTNYSGSTCTTSRSILADKENISCLQASASLFVASDKGKTVLAFMRSTPLSIRL